VGAGFANQWHFPQPMVDALEHQYAPFDNEVYEPLAGVIHLAAWRARAWEAALSEREMAVSFPGAVGEVLGLDIDMVLQQDPIDWSAQTPGRNLI
jgi:HD-like signal output (HDOD) protein